MNAAAPSSPPQPDNNDAPTAARKMNVFVGKQYPNWRGLSNISHFTAQRANGQNGSEALNKVSTVFAAANACATARPLLAVNSTWRKPTAWALIRLHDSDW